MGFEINKYDPCVASKLINDHQFTIYWYMDSLKLSHQQPEDLSKVLETLNEK